MGWEEDAPFLAIKPPLGPKLAIEHSVIHRFLDMLGGDVGRAGQVGNGAGDSQHFVVGAGGKSQLVDTIVEQLGAYFIEWAESPNLPACHLRVVTCGQAVKPLCLKASRR